MHTSISSKQEVWKEIRHASQLIHKLSAYSFAGALEGPAK